MSEHSGPGPDGVSRETPSPDPANAAAVSRETETWDEPGPDQPEVAALFGSSLPTIVGFHDLLRAEGEVRGLVGPRELDRLWSRHLLNSAAVVPFLTGAQTIVDLGSGAGLPGVVVAAMRPDAQIILIEPMERRCTWLTEVADRLDLANVEVRRGRAEEFHDAFEVDAVTARAVAPLDRLGRWAFPLLRPGGVLVALKGRSAAAEVEAATKVLRRYAAPGVEILQAPTVPQVEPTTVVRAFRKGAAR